MFCNVFQTCYTNAWDSWAHMYDLINIGDALKSFSDYEPQDIASSCCCILSSSLLRCSSNAYSCPWQLYAVFLMFLRARAALGRSLLSRGALDSFYPALRRFFFSHAFHQQKLNTSILEMYMTTYNVLHAALSPRGVAAVTSQASQRIAKQCHTIAIHIKRRCETVWMRVKVKVADRDTTSCRCSLKHHNCLYLVKAAQRLNESISTIQIPSRRNEQVPLTTSSLAVLVGAPSLTSGMTWEKFWAQRYSQYASSIYREHAVQRWCTAGQITSVKK